ncbi:LysM peptidoglycan-binding domain-containing protein [Glaciecola sp. MH2013]|uniref:LysM peptidoglycan-binding domain-containing protein n=1 Tax=Glaciecola sp. MH2013 TaxID=2785524 RepID=UPI001E4FB4C3|nr:LysM domain-containing protein [Glaciecola sp. MH2013]
MIKKLSMLALIVCGTLLVNMKSALADIINIKTDAPQTYVVKKGDTLWDISNLFLDQPWLWPELWRNNTQIENPHLIYPGDELRLRYIDGEPVIELVRDKTSISLTPDSSTKVKPSPIGVLPWKVLSPYIRNDRIMSAMAYNKLPHLLGDNDGVTAYVEKDFVLSHRLPDENAEYEIVRKEKALMDLNGELIGFQVRNVGRVEVMAGGGEQQIVRLVKSNSEARRGDKLSPIEEFDTSDLVLSAATDQVGVLIANIEERRLIGKRDVVVINLGSDEVSPGMVMGVYKQGPVIIDGEQPKYEVSRSKLKELLDLEERIEQPAFKIGELVVFKTFDNASYAWVTKSNKHMMGGEFVGKP